MSLFVLDTDLLTLYYRGDPVVVGAVGARSASDLAISVMTVDEQLTGWYTLTRRARLPGEIAPRVRESCRLRFAIGEMAHPSIHGIGDHEGVGAQGPPVECRPDGPSNRRDRDGERGCGRVAKSPRLQSRPRPEHRGPVGPVSREPPR